jgi:hypothetical protein
VLISLDLVGVDQGLTGRIRLIAREEAGAQPEHVVVAATHTHSGPGGIFDGPFAALADAGGPYNPSVIARIEEGVRASLRAAVSRLQPAELRRGRGDITGVAGNRTNPEAFADTRVGVLAVTGAAGQVIALVYNFACHPTVLNAENLAISADFPGAAASALQAEHPGAVVLFLNSYAGDISTRYTRTESSFAEVQRFGDRVVAGVRSGLKDMETVAPCGIAGVIEPITLPVRNLDKPDLIQRLAEARTKYEQAVAGGLPAAVIRSAATQLEGATAIGRHHHGAVGRDVPAVAVDRHGLRCAGELSARLPCCAAVGTHVGAALRIDAVELVGLRPIEEVEQRCAGNEGEGSAAVGAAHRALLGSCEQFCG